MPASLIAFAAIAAHSLSLFSSSKHASAWATQARASLASSAETPTTEASHARVMTPSMNVCTARSAASTCGRLPLSIASISASKNRVASRVVREALVPLRFLYLACDVSMSTASGSSSASFISTSLSSLSSSSSSLPSSSSSFFPLRPPRVFLGLGGGGVLPFLAFLSSPASSSAPVANTDAAAADRAAASLARIAPERPLPPVTSGAAPDTKSIAKCSAIELTNPSFAVFRVGSASAATTAVRSCLKTDFSASSCVLVLFPSRVFALESSAPFAPPSSESAFWNHPCTTPSSAALISTVFAPDRANPPDTFSTEAKHARRNASACFRCSTSASAPFRFGTGGAARMVRIRAMHLSRGTRKLVSGLKVKIKRKPCSGFSFASSARGSRRNDRLRPPSFPSI
mmetsp:Transcript_5725/g.18893  ORF Transcript_5725/g.18893 Transcript_5725/m.18893 type:complete len:401 (-) Transcript_5725:736-1938(-)